MVTASPREPTRMGDRLLMLLGVRLVVWLLAAQAFLPGALLDPVEKISYYHDEHNVIMHEESARIALGDYHQIPAWNPYFCGGIVELSNAPSNALAPDFLLRVIYGTLAGRRLAVLLFVVLGMEGTFRYARRNGASAIGAAMGAVAFSTSAHFVSLITWGWIFMFHYNLVPWVAYSYEEGVRKRWWIIVGGFFIAWLVLGGGTYVLPYTALVLLCLVVIETARAIAVRDVKWWRPFVTAALMACVAGGLSAIRFLPLLDLVVTHARPVDQKDQTGPISILTMLAVPKEHAAWGAGAGEYYVGSTVFVLALLALVIADRKAAKMWIIGLVFAVFACGEFVENAPYLIMRKMPLFSQLRFPIRMVTICALFVALAGARGLTLIEDLLPRAAGSLWRGIRRRRPSLPESLPLAAKLVVATLATGVAAYVGISAAYDVIKHNSIARGTVYNMDGPQIYADPYGFRQARGNRWDAHVWPFASRGSLHCFEEHQLFESPYVRGDLQAEEYGAPDSDTKVKRISWSPHRIVLEVHANGPGRFLVNQNHADAWKTDVGTLDSDGGLISVRVPPGDHVVTLTYSDWKVRLGALITFATVLAIVIAGVKRLRRRAQAYRRWWRILPERSTSSEP